MIDELQPDEIESVLRRHHIGRLAWVVDGEPYLVPLTYTYSQGAIYGHTLPGQKLDAMRAMPRVAFEVDERWQADSWRSVVVRGGFEELTAPADREAALAALRGAYPDAARSAGSGVVFRIRPTEMTGRIVQRSEPFHHHSDFDHPLHGIDLRAGDEMNFPHRED
jgi:nitroimidazol reductase NimA-like FMN-containing flavoprotein (pyridoxamine 5'-phosphate oxidase superfamily)